MNKKLIFFFAVALTGLALGTVSCSDKDDKPGSFSVGKNSINVAAAGGSETFTITANISWSVSVPSSASWITVSPASGTGNTTITVTVAENKATTARTAEITISAKDVGSVNVTVNQAAAESSGTPSKITIAAIQGVTPPVAGATPVTAITETDQYTGTVTWSPAASVFGYSTNYTATIIIVPKTGYTLEGVAANFFTVAGTVSAAGYVAGGNTVTAAFPTTGSSGGGGTPFVAVTDITGVPTTAIAGTPLTLTGTVVPTSATNKTITWNVQDAGTTGATTSGNTLNTLTAGTAIVRATIANGATATTAYTKDFNITVNVGFVAVTDITGVPTTITVSTPITLSGTVIPASATNNTIVWNVASGPGNITGNTLDATAAGTIKVTATIVNGKAASGLPAIANYTKNFDISASTVPVPAISVSTVNVTWTNSLKVNQTVTNAIIEFKITNSFTYAASIEQNDFKPTNLPAGLTTSVSRVNDNTVRVTIGGAPTTATTSSIVLTFPNISASNVTGATAAITPTGAVNLAPVAKANGANVTKPTAGTVTTNSITVTSSISGANPGGQTIEYAIGLNTDMPASTAWQSSPTFNGLTAGTGYYVIARAAEKLPNYATGAGLWSDKITTTALLKSVTVGSQVGTLTAGASKTVTFNVTTSNIANGATGSISWYGNSAGTGSEISQPPSLSSATVSNVSSNSATVTITTSTSVPAGQAFFKVTVDGTTSGVATLKIDAAAPLAVTVSPATQGVDLGQSGVKFTATATGGAGPYTYQWQSLSALIIPASWSDRSGATSNELTINVPTGTGLAGGWMGFSKSYRCVVSDGVNSVTSATVTITLNAATLTVSPASLSFTNSDMNNKSFTVTAKNLTANWTIEKGGTNPSDFDVDITTGSNGVTTIKVKPNYLIPPILKLVGGSIISVPGDPRYATLTITGGGITRTVSLIQTYN